MELVRAADRLTNIFGHWPTFHDAEVVRVVLDRRGPGGPTLEAEIHVFEMTSEVDPAGYYVLKNHTLVTLRFRGVELRALSSFNHQNVLYELSLTPIDPAQHAGRSVAVELVSSFGMEASFECGDCEVVSVQPWEASS